jgi:macrolide transport system ATP-binding/permease protein
MSPILSAHDLVKIYGPRRVIDGVGLTASPGQRLGLIGENGVGKSTLLRLLAGLTEPDAGSVSRPPDIGFLHQELPHPGHAAKPTAALPSATLTSRVDRSARDRSGATIGTVVDDALAEIREMQRRLDTLAARLQREPDDAGTLSAYGEALQWATDHDLWDADRRADLVLAGLGLAGTARDRRLDTLSGGERSRLGLAALLVRQPRALLLDEPTNHLDDAAVELVEAHLARLPGVVVLASHDRVFLDAVCTEILDLDPSRGGVTRYGGSYTDYLAAKRTERRRWEEQYATEQEQLKELRRAVATTARQVAPGRGPRDNNKLAYDRHGARVESQVSRRVRNAQRRLDDLERDQVRRPPAPLRFRSPLTATGNGHRDGLAVSLRQVQVPGRLRVDQLDLPAAGRLLVTGPNGAGKSTLLQVLAGRLTPATGSVERRRGLRVGLLEQDVAFPDPAATPRHVYRAELPGSPVPLTDLGLVAPRDLDRPVGQLSVGQRRRLALALLVGRAPDLLLLDEPTNHISLALAEELEEALRSASGAVVAASHDRWLRRSWTGPVLRVTADHRAAVG